MNNNEVQRFEAQYRQNPDSLVFARLADAYRRAGDPGRAIEILDSGIARHRNYPSAHIVRAKTCLDLGQAGSAEESFLRVLELDSGNLVALRGLAALARERGDLASARQWFQRISGLHPESADSAESMPIISTEPLSERPTQEESNPLPQTHEEWWTPDPDSKTSSLESEHMESAETSTSDSAEAWWFEDPDEGESSDDGDLLTRTMAQLYEKQGLMEEAAAIYKELLADRPEDEELRAAIKGLETRLASNLPELDQKDDSAIDAPDLDDPGRDFLDVSEPVAAEARPGTSGQSEVFLAWLRRLGE